MVIGTSLGLPDGATVALSVLLAFVFGYALTVRGVLRAGLPLQRAVRVALAADTVSILVMEIVDNAVVLGGPSSGHHWPGRSPSLRRHSAGQPGTDEPGQRTRGRPLDALTISAGNPEQQTTPASAGGRGRTGYAPLGQRLIAGVASAAVGEGQKLVTHRRAARAGEGLVERPPGTCGLPTLLPPGRHVAHLCRAFHRGRSTCILNKAGRPHSIPTNLRQD
jgi:hypothetical protein